MTRTYTFAFDPDPESDQPEAEFRFDRLARTLRGEGGKPSLLFEQLTTMVSEPA